MQMTTAQQALENISLKDIPSILPLLSLPEQEKLLAELEKLQELKTQKLSQARFLAFVNQVWPTFISGRHHAKMAAAFERVAEGKCKRLIINMPPRHTKSEFASYLLPAWFLGKFPHKKVIQTSHTAELAVGFGRKVRNLVDQEIYTKIFPGVGLQADSKAAGRWATNKGGDYFAIGVGGAVTGKGADLLIIDDPHSEQEAALAEVNPEIYDKTYEWYTSGPRQRLQPGGAIIIVMTRWSKRDLTGQVLKSAAQRSGDEWEVIEFPALFEENDPPRPLWPEFWSLPELLALKNELPNAKWMAQYQQSPVSEASAIVKREWWKLWDEDSPPACEFTLMSWDTAFEKTQRADYSACTLWGVFYKPDDAGITQANLIMLNAFRKRMEFPELKRKTLEEYKEWEPDSVIIEKKASGAPLIYELRAMGIPVQEFTPVKGNDKISRLNAVSDLFASGRVWAPGTRWAEEVIDEVASFPAGEHDDYVDSVSLALMRFRKGGFVRSALDERDEIPQFKSRRAVGYY
jgi:predicted phage terminase large subunit-like protein